MTLAATTVAIEPAGKLTLAAKTGVYITDHMTAAASNKALVINADSDSAGSTGALTVASTKTVTSNNSDVTITAFDVEMIGSLTAGTLTLSIHGAEAAQTIGLGASPFNMEISALELQRLTAASGFRLGSDASGSITVT